MGAIFKWGVVAYSEQRLTLHHTLEDGNHILVIVVYANCSSIERLNLWKDLYPISQYLTMSWIMGGDFNVILGNKEKLKDF